MSKRKRGKGFFDFGFDEKMFFGHEPVEGGSGYSISVTYDEKGKPLVKVRTYGDVNVAELRKEIERQYPGAKIEGLEEQPLIRVVDEKSEETSELKAENEKAESEEKEKRGSSIRIVE
jgi:hypothetical protein